MTWVRKSFVHLLSLILLVSLVGGVAAFSASRALAKPNVQATLKQSKIYDNFGVYVTEQAQKSLAKQQPVAGEIPFDSSSLKQAAKTAFPPQLLEQSVNTFLDANYAWLEGKVDQPKFLIDLSAAKQSFAEQVGQYAKERLAGLQICNPAQLAQLPNPANIDPLTAPCRPAALSPADAGSKITQQIAASDSFLSQTVLTPQTLNPEGQDQQQPYYTKLSQLPQAYQLGQKLPIIAAVLALLSTLGIILLALTRRKGIRRVGIVLLTAGLLLVILKFVSDFGFKRLESNTFNNTGAGQIQQSLVDFAHRLQHQLVNVDLYFGLIFLGLTAAIFIYLYIIRNAKPKSGAETPALPKPGSEITPQAADARPKSPVDNFKVPNLRNSRSDDSKPGPKPPRLIQ
jgi:hypothetical protein